jgi:hypothetical protein
MTCVRVVDVSVSVTVVKGLGKGRRWEDGCACALYVEGGISDGALKGGREKGEVHSAQCRGWGIRSGIMLFGLRFLGRPCMEMGAVERVLR